MVRTRRPSLLLQLRELLTKLREEEAPLAHRAKVSREIDRLQKLQDKLLDKEG